MSHERQVLPPASRGLSAPGRRGDRVGSVKCQICATPTTPGLDLGHQPVSDLILSRAQLNQPETLYAFFNVETADYIRGKHGQADSVSAAGVFGHIADLGGVMRGVKGVLAAKGIFATDSQYWLDKVLRMHYDNMFHQHLR